jgi:nicotinamidase-related amidase
VTELPVPPHFDPARVGEVWQVPYEERAAEAEAWACEHGVRSADRDRPRISLLAVDCQNTFCVPGFELFVAGRSGQGAVDDCRRLCSFVYRNLGAITEVVLTLDTHHPMQVFHEVALVDRAGLHPAPYTLVSVEDVEEGRWRLNPAFAESLGMSVAQGEAHLLHYVRRLREGGKYALTIWPYHALLGGVGHAVVSALGEAVFFHGIARETGPRVEVKGSNPLTEHYSVFGPEVTEGADGRPIGEVNEALIGHLLSFDAVAVAGQAKSHCVAWTVDDLLGHLRGDERLAERVYLLEDCSSPVVVPGAIDYTDEADAAFRRFREAGMHVVRSTDPIDSWV